MSLVVAVSYVYRESVIISARCYIHFAKLSIGMWMKKWVDYIVNYIHTDAVL